MQPSKASSRDWAHDPRADWRSREKKTRQGPPDKTAKTPSASLVGYRPTSGLRRPWPPPPWPAPGLVGNNRPERRVPWAILGSRRRGRPPATPSLASRVVIPLELAPPVPDHDALAALALAPRLQVRARGVPGRRREVCDGRLQTTSTPRARAAALFIYGLSRAYVGQILIAADNRHPRQEDQPARTREQLTQPTHLEMST